MPDLDLGVKSPSENYCTSEPFFSAYERLLGGEHDVLVLLTDYQQAKKKPPLRLQIIQWRYLRASQVTDCNLCRIALIHVPGDPVSFSGAGAAFHKQGFDLVTHGLEVAEAGAERPLQVGQAVEEAVVRRPAAQLLPEPFDGV